MGKKGKTKAVANPDAPRRKRGSPSDFQGSRLEFMQSRIPEYLKASKKKTTRDFWAEFMHDYWRLYPWRVPLDQEPPPGADLPPKDAEAAFKALDKDLTEEEEEEKSRVQTHTKAEAVGRRFAAEYGSAPGNNHISLRCKLAKVMLGEESEEVQKRINEENTAHYEAQVEAYEEEEEGLPSVEPDVQQQCRDKFTATVAPLLAGLRAYTGFNINLLAALSLNAGSVEDKDWAKWDPVGYGETLPRFLKFVHAEHMESKRSAGAAPDGDVPMPDVQVPAPPPLTTPAPVTTLLTSATPPLGQNSIGDNLIRMTPDREVTDTSVELAPGIDADSSGGAMHPDPSMGPPSPRALDDDDDDIMSGMLLPPDLFDGLILPPALDTNALPPPPAGVGVPSAPKPIPTVPAPAPAPALAEADAASQPAPTPPQPERELTSEEKTAEGLKRMRALEELVGPDESFGVRRMSIALHSQVTQMSEEERDPFVRRLRRMPSLELTRENNLARNKVWMSELGVSSATAFIGMKRTGGKKEKKKSKRAKKGEEDNWTSENSDSDSDDEESGDEGGERSTPPATRGAKKKA
ncbi:hypothetical protein C8R47DRAFT_1080103, partial [Mycena vitilis]